MTTAVDDQVWQRDNSQHQITLAIQLLQLFPLLHSPGLPHWQTCLSGIQENYTYINKSVEREMCLHCRYLVNRFYSQWGKSGCWTKCKILKAWSCSELSEGILLQDHEGCVGDDVKGNQKNMHVLKYLQNKIQNPQIKTIVTLISRKRAQLSNALYFLSSFTRFVLHQLGSLLLFASMDQCWTGGRTHYNPAASWRRLGFRSLMIYL